MKRKLIIILFVLSAGLFGAWEGGSVLMIGQPALAQSPGSVPAGVVDGPNLKCLICHDPEAAAGHGAPPVDTHALRTQIHKDLNCVNCHTEAAIPVPDQPEGRPHGKGLPRVTCMTECHQANGPTYYKDSIHGRLAIELGDRDVALCQDCHGDHDVIRCTDSNSKVAKCNLCQGCARCHENQELVTKHHIHREHPCLQWELSVHGRPRIVDGQLTVPAACTDCHGVHNIQGVGTGDLRARQPQTCGRCHPVAIKEYLESIHGIEAVDNNNPDAPLCVDCHGEHGILSPTAEGSSVNPLQVPDTCASCHARPTLMKKYGISADKVNTFINSFHGIAIGFNQDAVATCASCHGHHQVLPANDERSSVYPDNLPATCGKPECHPKMPQSIKKAKIHVDPTSPESGPIYWVRIVLVWMLILLLALSVIWIIPDILHRLRLKKTKERFR